MHLEIGSYYSTDLSMSHADERREHEAAIKRLRAEYDRLQNRIHAAYVVDSYIRGFGSWWHDKLSRRPMSSF